MFPRHNRKKQKGDYWTFGESECTVRGPRRRVKTAAVWSPHERLDPIRHP